MLSKKFFYLNKLKEFNYSSRGNLLGLNKFDTKASIVKPLNTPSTFDNILARRKRDTKVNNIFLRELINTATFNIGTTYAEIF